MTEVAFAGLPILTAPGRVMTPREASEQLVAEACSWIGDRPARICDVGTGSGAVALAIARACPEAEVWATDTSRCAVALARTNVRLHGFDDRVFVQHGDLLDPVPGDIDLIVANLPYLPMALAPQRPELAAEPTEAVFAAGDGLDHYRRLLALAPERLSPDGHLLLQLHRRVHSFSRSALAGRQGPPRAADRSDGSLRARNPACGEHRLGERDQARRAEGERNAARSSTRGRLAV